MLGEETGAKGRRRKTRRAKRRRDEEGVQQDENQATVPC